MKMTYIIPCKHLVMRNCMCKTHNLFILCAIFFINKIAYHHVKHLVASGKFIQFFEYRFICSFFYPVITVYHLEK